MGNEEDVKQLANQVAEMRGDIDALSGLLQKLLNPDGKIDLNLKIEDLVIRFQNTGSVTMNLDNSSTPGRIIWCAFKDLEQKPFSIQEMSDCLDNNGWHVERKTLSNTFPSLITKGLIIRVQKDVYRLPSRVKYTEGATL